MERALSVTTSRLDTERCWTPARLTITRWLVWEPFLSREATCVLIRWWVLDPSLRLDSRSLRERLSWRVVFICSCGRVILPSLWESWEMRRRRIWSTVRRNILNSDRRALLRLRVSMERSSVRNKSIAMWLFIFIKCVVCLKHILVMDSPVLRREWFCIFLMV